MHKEEHNFSARLAELQNRLRTVLPYFPYPAFIAAIMIMTFGGYLFHYTNPRKNLHAELIRLEAENEREGSIWISIAPVEDELVVTTNDDQVIRLPLRLTSREQLKPLISYFEERVEQKIELASLQRGISSDEISVVMAVDQRLRYAHIRPVLQAIAEAKITNYGFETINELASIETSTDGRPH